MVITLEAKFLYQEKTFGQRIELELDEKSKLPITGNELKNVENLLMKAIISLNQLQSEVKS